MYPIPCNLTINSRTSAASTHLTRLRRCHKAAVTDAGRKPHLNEAPVGNKLPKPREPSSCLVGGRGRHFQIDPPEGERFGPRGQARGGRVKFRSGA